MYEELLNRIANERIAKDSYEQNIANLPKPQEPRTVTVPIRNSRVTVSRNKDIRLWNWLSKNLDKKKARQVYDYVTKYFKD